MKTSNWTQMKLMILNPQVVLNFSYQWQVHGSMKKVPTVAEMEVMHGINMVNNLEIYLAKATVECLICQEMRSTLSSQ